MSKATKSIIVDVPMAFFHDIITDYEGYPTFSSDVKTAKIDVRDGNATEVDFTIRVLTRPFDYRLRLVVHGPTKVDWTLVSSGTLAQNDGGWDLVDLGDGRTEVTYWNELAAKRFLPKAFINSLAQIALPKMLKEWKRHAEALWASQGAAPQHA